MSQLSIKYGDPENPENFFFFTRDIEYNKVTIYQNGKVLQTITEIADLQNGINFKNAFDQEVFARLVNKRNFALSVSVNGDVYTPMKDVVEVETKIIDGVVTPKSSDVRSIAWFFAILLIIQLVNIVFFSQDNYILRRLSWSQETYSIYFVDIMSIPIICYAVAIYVLHDNRGWVFFLGLPVLLIFTGLELYNYYFLSTKWGIDYPSLILVSIFIRVVICILLLTKIRRVVSNLKSRESVRQANLLDEN